MSAAFGHSGPAQVANTLLNVAERKLGRERLVSRPLTMQVEVTSRCNLNCTICSRSSTPFRGEDLRQDLVEPVIELSSLSRELVLFGYGEPLIAEPFDRLLEGARSGRVSFVTNGLVLDRARAEHILASSARPIATISFSIDAAEADTYLSIRQRSDFERVWANLEGVAGLVAGRAYPALWIDFVAMRRNVAELPKLVEKAARAGVARVNVFNLVVWDASYAEESLIHEPALAADAFADAARVAEGAGITLDLPAVPDGARCGASGERSAGRSVPPPCFDPWSYAYIRQDGTVQACCFSDAFEMGDITAEPFGEIWNNRAYRDLRASVNSSHPPEACRTCEQRWRKTPSADDASVYLKLQPRSGPWEG